MKKPTTSPIKADIMVSGNMAINASDACKLATLVLSELIATEKRRRITIDNKGVIVRSARNFLKDRARFLPPNSVINTNPRVVVSYGYAGMLGGYSGYGELNGSISSHRFSSLFRPLPADFLALWEKNQ